MSAAAAARTSQLDAVLDEQAPTVTLAEELFAVVDALAAQPVLRNAVADPTAPEQARQELVSRVFTGRISAAALAVCRAAAGLRWGSSSDLSAGLERQAVRALFASADAAGQLDLVEDELFRFERIVDSDAGLATAIGDRSVPLADRQHLVSDLVAAKVNPITLSLARRGVAAGQRTFDLTVASYLSLAAAQRGRAIAQVTVARPLQPEQADRLRTALSRQVGRPVSLQVVIDPSVVGGVRVRLGDEVIDGTVAGRLDAANRQLT